MTVLLISSVFAIAIYACFTLVLALGVLRLPPGHDSGRVTVSIVVAAHDEAETIEACLNALQQQTYPRELLEIVVVNDRSTDQTGMLIDRYRRTHPEIVAITIDAVPDGISPKKHALQTAIVRATGQIILTTDADCRPPEDWITGMVRFFDAGTGLVAGPAPFENGVRLFRDYQNIDHLAATLVSAGGAGWNVGVTCTGRNLAYRKAVFEEIDGFASFAASLSGDDDWLLQRIATTTGWKICYALTPQVMVPSNAVTSLKQYITQRRRHVSAGRYYAMPIKLAYFVFNLANSCIIMFVILALFTTQFILPALSFLGIKFTLDFAALSLPARKLGRTINLQSLLKWEFGYFLDQLAIAPTAFAGRVKWK
jgi:cellulose synthase/poly-beta-1,6-N-acetylglucosamine synthase-like glycosyltransferase